MTRPDPHDTQPPEAAEERTGPRSGLFDLEGAAAPSDLLCQVLGAPVAGLWLIDMEARTILVNERLCEILGYEADEIMGRPIFDFMDDEGKALAARNVERRAAGINEDHTFRLQHRLGHTIWTRMITGPVQDGTGEHLGSVAWVEELDGPASSAEELRLNEALMRAALENSPSGIVIADAPSGHIRMANAAARAAGPAGTPEPEGTLLSQLPASDLAYRPDGSPLPRGRGSLSRALLGEVVSDEEVTLRHPDGTERVLLCNAAPVRRPGGEVGSAILVFTDVTERRRLEQEHAEYERRMIEASRMESVGRLAGGVAHNFNNLLATLLGRAELALLHLEDGHPARNQVDRIIETVQQSADLTRKMLAYAGRAPLDAGPQSVSEIAASHLDLVRASLPRAVTLREGLSRGLPPVRGDAAQLRHLLTELVEVAAGRASPLGGAVEISTSLVRLDGRPQGAHPHTPGEAGTFVRLAVRDWAEPLPAPVLDQIFRTFDPGTRRRSGGYDLSLVLGIVSSHDGTLCVEQPEDGGTLVSVLLPCTEEESAPILEATAGLRLLVVDDEHEVCETLCELLGALGHHPQGVGSGLQALSQVAQDTFDLCILDLTMPDMDGAEVALRMARIDPELPVLVCSGWAPAEVLPRFGDHPPAGILQKPVMPKTLLAAMEKIIQRRD